MMIGYILKAELVHAFRIRFILLDDKGVTVMAVEFIEWDGICEAVQREVSGAAIGNRCLQLRFNVMIRVRLERLGWLVIGTREAS